MGVFPILLAGCTAWTSGPSFLFSSQPGTETDLNNPIPCCLFPLVPSCFLAWSSKDGSAFISPYRFVLEHRLFEMEELRVQESGEETWASAPGGSVCITFTTVPSRHRVPVLAPEHYVLLLIHVGGYSWASLRATEELEFPNVFHGSIRGPVVWRVRRGLSRWPLLPDPASAGLALFLSCWNWNSALCFRG